VNASRGDPASSSAVRHPDGPSGLLALFTDSIEDYAIFALDADGNVATWNAGAERAYGHPASAIIGRSAASFFMASEVDAGKPERDLAIAVADGHIHEEGWRTRQDGSVFWADVLVTALRGGDGRLVGFGVVTRDLTERRRGDDMLRESQERFRLLVNSVADYAIFVLDPDGYVASWNLGAERLKGYRAEEIIGRHFSVFYPADDVRRELPQQLLRTAFELGRVESEGWRLRKDGSRFWASVVITALRADDGTHRGFAKVTKDLTDRKRNEDALRGVLEREREAAERFRELDRMRTAVLEIVAHDLRAPLSVIQTLAYALESGWDELDDATRRAQLERIVARTTIMSELVENLFNVVRVEAGLEVDRVVFDIGELAVDTVQDALMSPDAERVRILVDGDVSVLGDRAHTWEILANLLTNAVKFAPGESPVTVAVARVGDMVEVAVTDQGGGIAIEHQHLLFHRFSRVSPDLGTPGTGVGLFIARTLTEAQGGTIWVRSSADEGATFTFTVPAAMK